jgi:KRAB domain-containing zinc finger protein
MKNSTEHVFNFDDDDGAAMEPLLDTKPLNTPALAPADQKALDEARRLKSQKSKEKEMCDICGVYFVNVEQHRRIHSLEGLTCIECDIRFEDRRAFLRHNKKHRDTEKKASCDQCGKGFTNIYHLNKHLKKHIKVQKIGGEKLKCDTCNRTFFDKKEMGSHVCKHHSCEICGIKFLRARNLRLHARMHSGEVVYPCELCESLFLNKKRRREHFRDYHTNNEKKYKCDICDKRFLVKVSLYISYTLFN